jgi:hypothetical protein
MSRDCSIIKYDGTAVNEQNASASSTNFTKHQKAVELQHTHQLSERHHLIPSYLIWPHLITRKTLLTCVVDWNSSTTGDSFVYFVPGTDPGDGVDAVGEGTAGSGLRNGFSLRAWSSRPSRPFSVTAFCIMVNVISIGLETINKEQKAWQMGKQELQQYKFDNSPKPSRTSPQTPRLFVSNMRAWLLL